MPAQASSSTLTGNVSGERAPSTGARTFPGAGLPMGGMGEEGTGAGLGIDGVNK